MFYRNYIVFNTFQGTPMAFSSIETDIRGKLYSPVTIQFRTIAYPEPEFIWEKLTNGFWKQLTNDNMFFISSHKLQSNLTVFNFTSTTEDLYRLVVRNEIGTLIQNYSLKPFGKNSILLNWENIHCHLDLVHIYLPPPPLLHLHPHTK